MRSVRFRAPRVVLFRAQSDIFIEGGGGLGVFSAFCCRGLARLVVNYSLDCHLLQFGTLNVCTYRISLTADTFVTEKVSYEALKRVLVWIMGEVNCEGGSSVFSCHSVLCCLQTAQIEDFYGPRACILCTPILGRCFQRTRLIQQHVATGFGSFLRLILGSGYYYPSFPPTRFVCVCVCVRACVF